EVQHVRYEYAALVSMCDEHLGKVLDLMDELEMWDDTMLIVNTDHGFLLGEHDWWAKVVQPFYQEIAHVPLFIWDPRSRRAGEHRRGIVQMIDMPATLLEFFGVELPKDMQGIPLRDSIANDAPVHKAGLFGIYGGHVNVTDGKYVYMRAPASPDNSPLFEYTLMPTHMRHRFTPEELQEIELAEPFEFTKGCRTMRIKARKSGNAFTFGTMLFDVEVDPGQESPLDDAQTEQRMIREMIELMKTSDSPPEQFVRLGLL
ncbi:MAG: sulfatase-like hydrolase/transferase, partial [Caldilineaceae bacterium]